MPECQICGGRFAENICAYCGKRFCSSCMINEVKCLKCRDLHTVPISRFLKKNLIFIALIGSVWIYAVYPFPFLYALGFDIDISIIQPVLIATIVLAIPFIFMLMVWQRRPPRNSY